MKVVVLDEKGHSEFNVGNTQEALTQIQKYPNKWVFIDGEFVSETNTISQKAIEEAEEIVITDKLIGG